MYLINYYLLICFNIYINQIYVLKKTKFVYHRYIFNFIFFIQKFFEISDKPEQQKSIFNDIITFFSFN